MNLFKKFFFKQNIKEQNDTKLYVSLLKTI